MNSLTLAIILQLVGVAVIIAEIILPSGGFISLVAIGIFGYSLFLVFHDISTTVGIIFVTVDIITIPILILLGLKLLSKSPATLKTALSKDEGVTSQSPELSEYIGKKGVAVCDLHPAGAARIEDTRLDVVSQGEYITKNSKIRVIDVTGNQIIVQEDDSVSP